MQNTAQILESLKDFIDPELLKGLEGGAPEMPAMSEADRLKRITLLEKVAGMEWAPVKSYLDGMLESYRVQLEPAQSDASTNYIRGSLAQIRFFLSLPSMAQQELSAIQALQEAKSDTSEGKGSE